MRPTPSNEIYTHYLRLDRIAAEIDEMHAVGGASVREEEMIEDAIDLQIKNACKQLGDATIMDIKITDKHLLIIYKRD